MDLPRDYVDDMVRASQEQIAKLAAIHSQTQQYLTPLRQAMSSGDYDRAKRIIDQQLEQYDRQREASQQDSGQMGPDEVGGLVGGAGI